MRNLLSCIILVGESPCSTARMSHSVFGFFGGESGSLERTMVISDIMTDLIFVFVASSSFFAQQVTVPLHFLHHRKSDRSDSF